MKPVKEWIREEVFQKLCYDAVNNRDEEVTYREAEKKLTKIIKDMECMKKKEGLPYDNNRIDQFWKEWEGK